MTTIEIQCPDCAGTGLYVGMAERDGCAVVCCTCKGTGKTFYKYEPFKCLRHRDGVKRVFARSCGYAHAPNDVGTNKGTVLFSRGGCTYDEWIAGGEPRPVKDLYCPYLWSEQQMQRAEHPANGYHTSVCSKYIFCGCEITQCAMFEHKHVCWDNFEKLGGK
jgi:hypothetical protein